MIELYEIKGFAALIQYPEKWNVEKFPTLDKAVRYALEQFGKNIDEAKGVWPNLIAPPAHDNPQAYKVGSEWDDPAVPDMLPIWKHAREVGYAVGIHGSLKRDFDLIAVPWTDKAVSSTELIQHLCDKVGLSVLSKLNASSDIESKPQGRVAVTLRTGNWQKNIDLSIMPVIQIHSPAPYRKMKFNISHQVTADEAKQAMLATGKSSFPLRECGICGTTLNYVIQDNQLFYDADCDCGSSSSNLQPRKFLDVARTINMQTASINKKHIAAIFGIEFEE